MRELHCLQQGSSHCIPESQSKLDRKWLPEHPGAPRSIFSVGSFNILHGLEAGKERIQREFVANFDKKSVTALWSGDGKERNNSDFSKENGCPFI